ncbi:acetyltransferase component of pyruvate dehydrogenase complex [Clostridia bacterium]|nr:acetyltransferase component of pyruvate dehydrogenase complex [Clostridia bacterium]
MASNILMPAGAQTTAESKITQWLVKEGDRVKRGDILFEIETDKAVMSVESFAQGTVLKLLYEEGDSVETGSVVAIIGKEGEQIASPTAAMPSASGADDEDDFRPIRRTAEPRAAQVGRKAPDAPVSGSAAKDLSVRGVKAEEVLAMPAARKYARENNVDLAALFEKTGRPLKLADVEEAVQVGAGANTEADSADTYETFVPSVMRRTIAARMLESVKETPQYTVSIKPDMTASLAFLSRANEALKSEEVKVSLNDILILCVASAAKKVPYIRGIYEEEIRIYNHISIGVAVALPDAGLIVPVVKNADTLSLTEIARQSRTLIEKARSGCLPQQDIEGGNLTISNLGMYGIDRFTAIINRPESVILAVGAIQETPVRSGDALQWVPVMDITATFDHRLIDGAVGAQFMAALKQRIENPTLVLV